MTVQWVWRATAQQQMDAYKLTPGEQRIAWALLQAKTNEEVSAEFGLSPQTVKNCMTRMLKKTGTQHRLEFVLALLQVIDTAKPPEQSGSLPRERGRPATFRRLG